MKESKRFNGDLNPEHKKTTTFGKHAYSNILKILPPKNEKKTTKKQNQIKILIFFIFLLKT